MPNSVKFSFVSLLPTTFWVVRGINTTIINQGHNLENNSIKFGRVLGICVILSPFRCQGINSYVGTVNAKLHLDVMN